MESLATVSKDGYAASAGDSLVLRSWQKELLNHLFARRPNGRLRHRVALIGLPRKNGKSSLGSALALDGLIFGPGGAEVYSAAAEKEQARIVFGETKRMIAADPELSALCHPMRDVIEVPSTNSILRCLSAEAYSKEGLNISRAIVDELHAHPTRELWDVLTLASAARIDPLIVAITTAGVKTQSDGQDTVCYELYRHGLEVAAGTVDDPSFFFAWWGAPDDADHRDPAVWKQANPGYGDLIDPEDFESSVRRTPENEFRTKRLNQWVSSSKAWLPAGAWDACVDESRSIPDGTDVVLGFDGSYNNDSTALVVVTLPKEGELPHVDVVEAWEKPSDEIDWTVDILEVEEVIRDACRRWQVQEIACDPARWARTYQILDDEGLPVVTFPQSSERMVPATQRLYEAVVNQQVTHSGDTRLARHMANAATKTDSRGTRLTKDAKRSNRKIDLAVALVMAYDHAAKVKPRGQGIWSVREMVEELRAKQQANGEPVGDVVDPMNPSVRPVIPPGGGQGFISFKDFYR